MKTTIGMLVLGLTVPVWAQSWDVIITNSMTIASTNLSYDGQSVLINAATVTIVGAHAFLNLGFMNGACLKHATGDVDGVQLTISNRLTLATNSWIDVTGCGNKGTYTVDTIGGSHGGRGASYGGASSPCFGDHEEPVLFGGGSKNYRGGGVIRIAAGILQVDGAIVADGANTLGSGLQGGGAGGSIWLTVGTLCGVGQIRANGGYAVWQAGSGGGGRVAIYYADASGFDLTSNVQASGWHASSAAHGGAGTIYLKKEDTGEARLLVNNQPAGLAGAQTELGISQPTLPLEACNAQVVITGAMAVASISGTNATIYQNAALTAPDDHLVVDGWTWVPAYSQTWANVTVTNRGKITHTVTDTNGLRLWVAGTLNVATNSAIDVSGGGTKNTSLNAYVGGSYGGRGGNYGANLSPLCYGDIRYPDVFGGGSYYYAGGGIIRIVAGTLQVDGTVSADGLTTTGGNQGGSAGGSIWLSVGTLRGGGQIRANGGNATWQACGGGGGRIAVYYTDATGFNLADNVRAWGTMDSSYPGGAGTVYLKNMGTETEQLLVKNNRWVTSAMSTELGIDAPALLLEVYNAAAAITGATAVAGISGTNAIVHQNAALTVPDNSLLVNGWTWNPNYYQVWANVTVTNIGKITHPVGNTNGVRLNVTGALTIATNCSLDVSSCGNTNISLNQYPGGSYGGRGGNYGTNESAAVYGSETEPSDFGEGVRGYRGGGKARVEAEVLQLDGSFLSNGQTPVNYYGGAAGGSLWINVGSLRGGGSMSANGATAGYASGGGGGRIAIYCADASSFNLTTARVTVTGGGSSGYGLGSNGTIYIENRARPPAVLSIDPSGATSSAITRILVNLLTPIDPATFTAGDVTLTGPSGPIVPSSVTSSNQHVYAVNLPGALTQEGLYQLTIGPAILSTNGTALDQDRDGAPGEAVDDVFAASFTVDLTPPAAPTVTNYVMAPASNNLRWSSAVLRGTREADTAVWIQGVQRTGTGTGAWTHAQAFTQGVNRLRMYAKDRAGHSSPTSEVIFFVDSIAPAVTAAVPANNAHTGAPPAWVRLTYTEAISGLDTNRSSVSVQRGSVPVAGTWAATTNTLTFTPGAALTGGVYTVAATLIDWLSNTGTFSSAFTVDAAPPAAPGVYPVSTPTFSTNQLVSGTRESYAAVRLNGMLVATSSASIGWSHTVTLTPGVNTLGYSVVDRAGNVSPTTTVEIVYINVAPVRVMAISPSGYSREPVEYIDLTYEYPLNTNTIGLDDFTLTGPQGELPLSQISSLNSQVYRLTPAASLSADGLYRLVMGTNISSITGHAATNNYTGMILVYAAYPAPPVVTNYAMAPVTNELSRTLVVLRGIRETNTAVWIDGVQRVPAGSGAWSYTNLFSQGLTRLALSGTGGGVYSPTNHCIFAVDSLHPAWDVIITNSMTIAATNVIYDGQSVLINAATVTIAGAHVFQNMGLTNGARLTHGPADGTGVYITVSSTLLVATNSSIDASACGARNLSFGNVCGGSYGGRGGQYNGVSPGCFGNFREPALLGGGSYYWEGGGIVRITVDTLWVEGMILADGKGISNGGGAAGGSVWLDVATMLGGGQIRANGGPGSNGSCGGGGGRVAIYYSDTSSFNLANNVQAKGGGGTSGRQSGGAGTVYLKDKGLETEQLSVDNTGMANATVTELGLAEPDMPLLINNAALAVTGSMSVASIAGTNAVVVQNAALTIPEIALGAGSVWTQSASLALSGNSMVMSNWTWTVNYSQTWASVTVTNGGKITHPVGSTNGLLLVVSGPLIVATNSSIDVSGCGVINATVPMYCGGSHGGRGGEYNGVSPSCYGDFKEPDSFGGGCYSYEGGGKAKIVANSLQIDGEILANGKCLGDRGASAGGSIWLDVGTLLGGGRLGATGGKALNASCGGGGGRIAVYYSDASGFNLTNNVQALGGDGNAGRQAGGAGTVYLKDKGAGTELLRVNNAGKAGAAVIELGITAPTVPLVIENAAVTITGSLSVASISGTNASVAQNAAVTSSSIALGNGVVWTQNAYWAVSESNLVVSKWTWSVNYSQTWASVTVTNGGKVTYPAGNTNGLWLNVTGTLAVATNSSIDVTGCGNVESGLFSRVGGSYGGRGGSSGTNLSLVTYGSLMEPVDFGGGSLSYRGGGKVRLTAGVLQLDGMLTANGATPGSAYGAPAGGSVWITTSLLQGGGTIQAKGGQGAINACGGGGGRIAIYYFDSMGFDLTGRVSAAGSAGSGGYESGSNGTVYLEHTKPATPVVSAYRITVSGFSANWSASSGTTNYILDVATDAAFTSYVSGYEHLSLGNVTNVAVTGLDDGQPYYCRVQAINSYGAGDYSEPITVNVPDAFTLLHSFAGGAGDGSTPFYGEPLVAGSTLYGMTSQGGADDVGLVFKMNVDGTGFAVLHEFGTSDGAAPYGSLLLSGSTLYGMTGSGGTNGYGVVFKISVDGTGFAVLHEFSNTDGAAPYGSLAMSGAKLYGTTSEGGSGGYGTLFSMNVDGTGFTVLHDFAYDSGAYPYSTPVVSGATLYGMASEGGSDGYGVVFKMNVDGTGYALLHQFAGGTGDGAYAFGSLTLAASTLYGMTYAGGASNKGVVFSIGTDGTDYALRHEFAGGPADGAAPQGSLTLLNSMVLGMTYDGGANSYGVVYQINLDGTGFTVLHQFAGTTNNGYQPRGSMTLSGSLLYGMVLMGGAHDKGIIYSYDLGRETVVLSGRVTDSGTGAGADGIPISFGDRAGMAVTAGGGYYTNAVSVGWSGQATPLQEDFEFTPPSRAYINVTTNQAGQNYTRAVAVPPPPAPESQAATGVTASGFAANWSASAGATNYLLDVSMNSSFTNCVSGYQDLPVGNALTKPVTGLSAGTMYYYRVRAANAGGTSGNSETISVLLVPPAPEAQTSTNASMTSFDAEWLAAAGATNYLLDVSWHEDFVEFAAGYANRSLGDVTWCVVTGLTEEATYYFRVRAQNGSGTSSNSATILVNMAPSPAPDAPEALAATEVDTTSFQANWNGVEGGTNYLLDVSTDESFSQLVNGYANRAVGDAASCLVTGLTPDVVYYYRVRAQDGNGVSASSGTITVPTQPLFWLPMASGMNADVQALAADGSNVYAGGVFTQAGGAGANYAAKWNGTNWAALGSGLNGSVLAVAAGGSKVYAGGTFTQAGGAGANYAAKWDGTNWTALGSGLNGSVSALAVDGSKVYAGGAFTTAGGAGANRIAKWDGTNWAALGSGLDGSVRAVAVYGARVYAGGEFTTAGGSNANYVAQWDGTNWTALGGGMNGNVLALTVDWAGRVYAGGEFSEAGGQGVGGVAVWDGVAWSGLGDGVNGSVSALAVDGAGNVYVGGSFTEAGELVARRVAMWDGNAWSVLGSGMNGSVAALTFGIAGRLYAGGAFTVAGGLEARYAAYAQVGEWALPAPVAEAATDVTRTGFTANWRGVSAATNYLLDVATDEDFQEMLEAYDGVTVGSGTNHPVTGLSAGSSYYYRLRAENATGISPDSLGVRVTTVAPVWSALGSGLNDDVLALAVDDGGIVRAGGEFTQAGGADANYAAAWSGTNWTALGSGLNGPARAMALAASSNVYAGGDFATAGGSGANRIAQWNGSAWLALGAGLNGAVLAAAADGSGNVYAGGEFTTAGGSGANRIAKWNGSAWTALGSGLNGSVRAVAADGATIYAGGEFTTAGGDGANYVAKWNGSAWSALGSGLNGTVYALAADGYGLLYAAGEFTTAGGSSANRVAMWDGTNWTALASGFNGTAYALALDESGNLYAGGEFTTAGDSNAYRVAVWTGSAWSALGDGMNGTVRALAVSGDWELYAGGEFTEADGSAAGHIALIHIGEWARPPSAPAAGAATNVDERSFTANWGAVRGAAGYRINVALDADFTNRVTGYESVDVQDVTELDVSGLQPDTTYYYRVQAYNGGGISAYSQTITVETLPPTVPPAPVAEAATYIRVREFTANWQAVTGAVSYLLDVSTGSGFGVLVAGYNGLNVGDVTSYEVTGLAPDTTYYYRLRAVNSAGTSANSGTRSASTWERQWYPVGSGMNSTVRALALSSAGSLYAGGEFTTAGGASANRVARWSGSSWAALGSGFNGAVYAVAAIGSSNLYAAGTFTTAGGSTANRIAKWTGSAWTPLGSGVNGAVYALAVDWAGHLYAAGDFTTAGGVSANRVAKWNGSAWSALGSGFNGAVYALAVNGAGDLYAAGHFTTAGGASANRVAKWNGNSWSTLGAGMPSPVRALALDAEGGLYAGGDFQIAGDVVVAYAAKWTGSAWTNMGSGLGGEIYALLAAGTNVYAGGRFDEAGGAPANYIAAWNGNAWSPVGSGMNGEVRALAVDGSASLYAGGSFTTADGETANRIATTEIGAVAPSPPVLSAIGSKATREGEAMSFLAQATDADGTIPSLTAEPLPAGASFTVHGNGTATFAWTPTNGQYGVYPVCFSAEDGRFRDWEIVRLYVGHPGEEFCGGIPCSLVNWGVEIKELVAQTSGSNATVLWDSVNGLLYEVYASENPFAAAPLWNNVGATQQGGGGEEELADPALDDQQMRRFYKLVLSGDAPDTNRVWGVIRKDVRAAAYTMIAPPLRTDRRFDGAMGAALADVLQGNDGGIGSGADEVYILQANGSWRTLYLDASGTWREAGGAASTCELEPGQGLWVARKAGTSARVTFTGPVGNDGTRTNRLVTGWNLIGLSEGKDLPLKETLATADPVGGAVEEQADILVLQNANGSWRRLMFIQGWGAPYDGNWFDLVTFQIVTNKLEPGAAYYYLRRGDDTEVKY